MTIPRIKTRQRILALLADAQFHSGTALGEELGISRAAVNKVVQQLTADGLAIHCVTGRGYCLTEPLELLDADQISQQLADSGHNDIDLHIHERLESTSRFLIEQELDPAQAAACLAEHQTAGRGRRGRQWLNTPYRNLMLSVARHLSLRPAELSGLSLAIGVAIVEALRAVGYKDVGLKWPNDLLFEGRKLGGVLVDLQGESEGPTRVVVGVGINLYLNEDDAGEIEQAWTDLRQLGPDRPQRNRLAAEVVARILTLFAEFEADGFAPYRDRWQLLNAHAGEPVALLIGDRRIEGVVEGVDESGALLLRSADGVASYHAGEISLRPMTV
ncbi:MAG: bifunctional biotin--[acetyl-CoA-carboxylase] ligase/biotin operon repressor BirA [Proteobacteria bacterium]|nr:bifunctional biotin--[acetyl-CoA-carboxylase] ligase/biotin operon repressor BirA [Pseudomonadota bacterium]